MRKLNYDELVEGMVLAEAIIDGDTGAELLRAGTTLTLRQIGLIRNLGIQDIIVEDQKPMKLTAKEKLDDLYKEIEKIESQIFPAPARNVVNKNMEVNILTGEGDIPIDVRHAEVIQDTRDVFHLIKETGSLDLERVKNNLVQCLPDMVRNNDVLMRLNQLKRSDDYTFDHSMRVSILSTMIGKWFGFSQNELLEISEAGMLYDIGKLSIPEEVLKKSSELSPEELEIIRKHPQLGYSILLKTKGVTQSMKYAALHHQERMDGSGYPLRLRENQIHYCAKIIMVCDVFDALTNDRPYKKKVSTLLALDYLDWNAGKLFDPEVVYVFIRGISHFLIGKTCRLTTGEFGKIVYIEENYPTRPIVKVDQRFVDLTVERRIDIEEVF